MSEPVAQTRDGPVLDFLAALDRQVRDSGREAAGPPRQVMIADWRTAGPDELASDLAIPLR